MNSPIFRSTRPLRYGGWTQNERPESFLLFNLPHVGKDEFCILENEIVSYFQSKYQTTGFILKRAHCFHSRDGTHTLARVDANLPASKEMFETIGRVSIRGRELLAGKDGELQRCLKCKGLGHKSDSDACPLTHSTFVIHTRFTCYTYQSERLTNMFKAETSHVGTPENPRSSAMCFTATYSRRHPLRAAHGTLKQHFDDGMISNIYHFNPAADCSHCGHRAPKHAHDCPHHVPRNNSRPQSIPPRAPRRSQSLAHSRPASPIRSPSVTSIFLIAVRSVVVPHLPV